MASWYNGILRLHHQTHIPSYDHRSLNDFFEQESQNLRESVLWARYPNAREGKRICNTWSSVSSSFAHSFRKDSGTVHIRLLENGRLGLFVGSAEITK